MPTTKTKDFAHAAGMLVKRPWFNPKIMYSDTWPCKKEYWEDLLGEDFEGRLGLFHYEKRIIKTLRKKHVDYFASVTALLDALYTYCANDYERLITALKDGSLAPTGKKYDNEDIAELKETKQFRVRYGKYLRKQLRPTHTMMERLDEWFCRFKVTATDPDTRPAYGRLDPIHQCTLFTPATKEAVINCKEKACFLEDPLPLNEMYDEILPGPNSKHNLIEYLSKRGESKLESFHDRFAHFANSGMRDSLADNLNLCGTARYNLSIRHKRALIATANQQVAITEEERKRIPVGWEKVVPYFNHTELSYVNDMAKQLGARVPFPRAEPLQDDTGERFFSEYMTVSKPHLLPNSDTNLCLCTSCEAPKLPCIVLPPIVLSPQLPRIGCDKERIMESVSATAMAETTATTNKQHRQISTLVQQQQVGDRNAPLINHGNLHFGVAGAPAFFFQQQRAPFHYY